MIRRIAIAIAQAANNYMRGRNQRLLSPADDSLGSWTGSDGIRRTLLRNGRVVMSRPKERP